MDWDALAGVEAPVDEELVEQELRAYMGVEPYPAGREPWAITNLGQADWAMRKVGEAAARVREYTDQMDLWRAARDRLGATTEWFERKLEDWARGQREASGAKSFALAHGTVTTREAKRRIVVEDEAATIAWAKAAKIPEAVATKESLRLSYVTDGYAAIEMLVVGFAATDTDTGEVERIEVEASRLDPDRLERLRERIGKGYVVEPILEAAVVDSDGVPVPGLGIKPGEVSAKVNPLGVS